MSKEAHYLADILHDLLEERSCFLGHVDRERRVVRVEPVATGALRVVFASGANVVVTVSDFLGGRRITAPIRWAEGS